MLRVPLLPTLLTLCIGAATTGQRPPNIVVVLADDLGYGDPGCYNDESRAPTPHIDRLAAEGRRWLDAHSPSSVCTPTRYGLLTGRYAWRRGLQRGVLWPYDPPLLEEQRTTLPELLRGAGYHTACVGKWHLGWDWPLADGTYLRDEFDGMLLGDELRAKIAARVDFTRPLRGGPLAHGFDHYFGDDVPNFPPYAFFADDRLPVQPTATKPARLFGHAGAMAPGWSLEAVLPAITAHAVAWIDARAQRDDDRPFFLLFTLTSPHTPIAPDERFAGKTAAGAYGDWVAETDQALGDVLAALDRGGLAADTLVVFTSDNGSPQRDGTDYSGPVGAVKRRFGHDPSRPWRGLKSDAWEGGHRVPFLARWPGVTPAGTTCSAPLVLTDLYRTLAAVVGTAVAEGNGEDSFDQGAALRGDDDRPPARDHLIHHSGNGIFAVREGRWKLILGKGSGGFSRWSPPADAPPGQLYDLEADPGETVNAWPDHPEVVAHLRDRLQTLRQAGTSR